MSGSTSTRLVLCAAICSFARAASAATPDAGASPPADDGVSPNKTCLQNLHERGVDFAEVPTKGVRTSIRLTGANLGPLRLDQDLAPLRAALAGAPELVACVDAGGGRLMRAPTVFEDVVKMLQEAEPDRRPATA